MLPFSGLTLPRSFTVTIADATVDNLTISPADCTAGYRLGTDGKRYTSDSAGSFSETVGLEWLDPKDALEADLYECFATVTAGSLTTGTAGSWLALSSNRDWTKTRTSDAAGSESVTFTLAIRRIGMSTNLDTATIQLIAEVA